MISAIALALVVMGTDLIDADLDRAISLWNEYGMPIPGPNSTPVVIENGSAETGHGSKPLFIINIVEHRKGAPDRLYQGRRWSSRQGIADSTRSHGPGPESTV